MSLIIYMKNILLFFLDYLYFLKNDIFVFAHKSANGLDYRKIQTLNDIEQRDEVSGLEEGKLLKAYENDNKHRILATQESQVRQFFKIEHLLRVKIQRFVIFVFQLSFLFLFFN